MKVLCCYAFLIFLEEFFCTQLEEKCMQYARDVSLHHPTENLDAPDTFGKWISSRCEIIPSHYINSKGHEPKFIVRRFDLAKGPWNGFFYHYADSWCTIPKFIVKIKGRYDVMLATATTNSQPTKAASFQFANIYIRTKNKGILEEMFNFIAAHCPSALLIARKFKSDDLLNVNLEEYINRDISVNATEILSKKKCRYFFGLHDYSYQKIRMVHDKRNAKKSLFDNNIEHDLLYFADVPPQHKTLSSYPFNEFQYGLSRISNPDCEVCKMAKEHDDANTEPILTKPTNRQNIAGDWVSSICEASSGTVFITRYYKIAPKVAGKEFGEIYGYLALFSDSNCKDRSLGLLFSGIYTNSEDYKTADDVMLLKIKYTSLTVTPYDESMLSLIKFSDDANCGDKSKWKIEETQNVTECSPLQIRLPRELLAVVRANNGKNYRELYITEENEEGNLKYFTNSLSSCSSKSKGVEAITPTSKSSIFFTSDIKTFDPNDISIVIPKDQGQVGEKPPGNYATRAEISYALCLVIAFRVGSFI